MRVPVTECQPLCQACDPHHLSHPHNIREVGTGMLPLSEEDIEAQ